MVAKIDEPIGMPIRAGEERDMLDLRRFRLRRLDRRRVKEDVPLDAAEREHARLGAARRGHGPILDRPVGRRAAHRVVHFEVRAARLSGRRRRGLHTIRLLLRKERRRDRGALRVLRREQRLRGRVIVVRQATEEFAQALWRRHR